VAYSSTLGWSLLSSGLVTLLLVVLPGDSWLWGVGLLLVGAWTLYARDDRRY
jgi:hypothetical protein